MTAQRNIENEDFLSSFDLSSLAAGAARLRPDRTALIDDRLGVIERITFAEFDRRVKALAQAWRGMGLEAGDCILLIGGATATTIVALIAALRAGLDLALASVHQTPGDIAALAREAHAVALAGEPRYGDASPVEILFSTAAMATNVRLVCSLGAEEFDGAVNLDPAQLRVDRDMRLTPPKRSPCLWTIAADGAIVRHKQQTLIAAAFDFATRAQIEAEHSILTTFAPTTFAGLVSGPVANLLTGAPLFPHGPFDSTRFLDAISLHKPLHLVTTSAVTNSLADAGLLHRDWLNCLVCVTRANGQEKSAEMLAPLIASDEILSDVVDLYALGENMAIAEKRGADALAIAPALEPHYITLNRKSLLAIQRREDGEGFEGSAATFQQETDS